ncbi:hypothetical protein [Paracoccus sp. N5]|uniref:hypothetical protein n=1 Tax=Paracoccus sp. N5 TaxID=1101189 RepID=UPI0012F789B7|nr:hypothetical protein [Paracoccus sp. N5]
MAQNRRRLGKTSLIHLNKISGAGLLLAVISSPLQEICCPPPQLGRSTVNAFAGAPAPEDSKEERRFSWHPAATICAGKQSEIGAVGLRRYFPVSG